MTAWPRATLRSPLNAQELAADTPHSLAPTPFLPTSSERWPVLEGIPFLRADRRDLADQALAALDDGRPEDALVLLLADQDNWARTPPPAEADRRRLVRDAGSINFRTAMDLLAFGPVSTYFAHRWSDPTFLSGLALFEAHREPGPIFELACGVGHFLREFGRIEPHVAGGDIVFAKLWLARRYVAPTARLVCFDAAQPWPFAQDAFHTMFCHDAFYFLPEKSFVAQEMQRVAGGPVLVGHAHNALTGNLSAGSPMCPADYADLFDAPILYDDNELTAALVEARAPVPASSDSLAACPAIALADRAAPPRAVVAGVALPPPGAALRRNPLYAGGWIHWPSPRYETEYATLATYPVQACGPDTAVAGAGPDIDALARRRVLVDLPASW